MSIVRRPSRGTAGALRDPLAAPKLKKIVILIFIVIFSRPVSEAVIHRGNQPRN
jgi:hypothetical protein